MPLQRCNTENMRKLVDALRSDTFIQGRNALEREADDGTFHNCCLGVACRVAIADGLNLEIRKADNASNQKLTTFDHSRGFMPMKVVNWLGLVETRNEAEWVTNPLLFIDDSIGWVTAAVLNDDMGYSFAQIADAFERTYLTN